MDTTSAITIKDAAQKLKISERLVARLIADRTLPSLKLGRRRLIREAALAEFLNRQESVAR